MERGVGVNPDDYRGTSGYKTWTIVHGNVSIVFRVYSYGAVEIRYYTDGVEDTKSICQCDKETAREMWHSYIEQGFCICEVSQKRASRPERTRRKKQRVKSAMTNYDKLKMEAKKAYGSFEDYYKKNKYKNYALEA